MAKIAPIGSNVKLSSAVAAILVGVLKCRTQFWKRTSQESLQQSFSSNGQNCSILSQNVPKFELYKYNDELFNIYYRIFYELWTFADFDRLCKLTRRYLWEFPIGSNVKLSSSVAAILVSVLKCGTQIWKRTTQESFQQSLVEGSSALRSIFFFNFNTFRVIFQKL
jgi:hypothetical protein